MVNQLSSLLRDVKGVARRRTLFQKITCSLLKLCSGQIEELKERIGRGRKKPRKILLLSPILLERQPKRRLNQLQEVEDKLKGKLESLKGAV